MISTVAPIEKSVLKSTKETNIYSSSIVTNSIFNHNGFSSADGRMNDQSNDKHIIHSLPDKGIDGP
jgi:hypothetical protein